MSPESAPEGSKPASTGGQAETDVADPGAPASGAPTGAVARRSAGPSGSVTRRRALLATLPFLALGLTDLILIILWGVDPLWGFLILPPILFISALTWLAFRSGFARERAGGAEPFGGNE